MLNNIIRRILQIFPTLLVVVTLTFVITRLIPGDPVSAMITDGGDAELIEQLREEMGLNEPIWKQYLLYLKDILHGNFGRSFFYSKPAMEIIADRIPNTLLISLCSLAIGLISGLIFGILTALHQQTWVDYVFTVITLLGVSLPLFWFALMLVLIFNVNLGWLPGFGMGKMAEGIWDVISHMILPVFCLSIGTTATITRITRTSMVEAMASNSITALEARGIARKRIIWKHGLKNAMPPILTIFGMQLAGTISGSLLTERVFAWPGMGMMIYNAIEARDYSLIQAAVLVVGIAFIFINLITDIVLMVLNPKITTLSNKGGG